MWPASGMCIGISPVCPCFCNLVPVHFRFIWWLSALPIQQWIDDGLHVLQVTPRWLKNEKNSRKIAIFQFLENFCKGRGLVRWLGSFPAGFPPLSPLPSSSTPLPSPPKYVKSRRKKTGERTKQEENHQPNSKTISIQTNKPEWKKKWWSFFRWKNHENEMKKNENTNDD